jgi:hypothetical protein
MGQKILCEMEHLRIITKLQDPRTKGVYIIRARRKLTKEEAIEAVRGFLSCGGKRPRIGKSAEFESLLD